MLTELEVLEDVTQRLEREAIDYMLTGSVAMNYYAVPRMTRDIDLVVALEPRHADRLRSLFEPDYYVPHESPPHALAGRGMFNLAHLDSVVKLWWARESRSELQLRDVRNLLATGVDEAYLNHWADELGVAGLLREARHE